jgi:hypothetical protein
MLHVFIREILANMTQVSDVAPGPLVKILLADRKSMIRSVLKVVYFLCKKKMRTVWGIIFFIHMHNYLWCHSPLPFLVHLSWKLKWAILIARCPSSVCLSVRLSVNFYIFDFFSRTTGPILAKLGTNYPLGEGILNCSNEGDCTSPRGDNYKRVKIH